MADAPITKIAKYLANLGYGTRREVESMLRDGVITRRDGSVLRDRDRASHDEIVVDGEPIDPPPGVVIMLNKPVGYVCSTTDSNPLVYDLLPDRFRERTPIIAPVGRLDRDTSGLLLLTDDGKINHRLTSPKWHLPKVYEATLSDDVRADAAALFGSGEMMLDGEDKPLRPAALEVVGPRRVLLTITEGRYHQVRRMFAATGNHVVALSRIAVGPLGVGGLAEGEWRVLEPDEVAAIYSLSSSGSS